MESRPDFAAAIYGGWDDTFIVPDDAMPLFLCAPANDIHFTPEQSLCAYLAWRKADKPVEHHLYHEAEHGFGAIPTGHAVDGWMDAMFAFMHDVRFLKGNDSVYQTG